VKRVMAMTAACLAFAATAATAQDGPPPEGGRRGRGREEVFRLLDAYLADNLQARLGLTDDQLARALPLVQRLQADRRRFAERRMRALHQMRRMDREGAITDARAAEVLREMKAAEVEEAAAARADRDALDTVLTPAQQLRYRILEGEIEQRLRQVMARVRAQRRDGKGRRGEDGPRMESPAPR
jgi:hypothetical protein